MASPRSHATIAIALAAGMTGDLLAPSAWAGPSVAGSGVAADAATQPRRLRLDDPAAPTLALLGAFRNAEIERPGPVRSYLGGRWGRARPWWNLALPGAGDDATGAAPEAQADDDVLAWDAVDGAFALPIHADSGEEAAPSWSAARLADLRSMLPFALASWPSLAEPPVTDGFGLEPAKKEPPWIRAARLATACRRRPVTFVRYGAETDTFSLVGCDGSVAPEALDRLTLMARPPEVPRPGDLLPDEPDAETWAKGEWLAQVRPVHPRLVWLLQRVADAFPRRTIYVISGYRPPSASKGSHSFHGDARAMDIGVMGVRNEDLFRFCRTLDDVGCGYYPNSKFVHVDVRRPHTGRAFWVDASGPGEPSQYVDSWPGVVESGALVWDGRSREPY